LQWLSTWADQPITFTPAAAFSLSHFIFPPRFDARRRRVPAIAPGLEMSQFLDAGKLQAIYRDKALRAVSALRPQLLRAKLT
jgi:hypothetical protein